MVTAPIAAAAAGNPSMLIAPTQSGEKTTPPTLAPLYAIESAAGLRENQGETITLTAAAPIAAQPAPPEQRGDKELPGRCRAGPGEDADSQ